jgi:AAA15 family ATPase/GTPase
MKIQSITLENFRSVQSTVTIPLRPITLLFGPNSAGKSSILQSLLTFREVLKNRNANPHFVYGGGKHIDLGGFEALVNGHDLDKDLKIKIEFTIDDDGITDGSTLSRFIEQSGFWRLQDFGKVENGYVQIILSYDQK